MTRFVPPVFLGAVAIGVAVFNQRPDRKIVFPLLDAVSRDPSVQGHVTVGILAALCVFTGIWALIELVRERRDA